MDTTSSNAVAFLESLRSLDISGEVPCIEDAEQIALSKGRGFSAFGYHKGLYLRALLAQYRNERGLPLSGY